MSLTASFIHCLRSIRQRSLTFYSSCILCGSAFWPGPRLSAEEPWSRDPAQILERTCFQTSAPWSAKGDLRSDVAIVYGIGKDMPDRIQTWRDHGYRIHVMTGVSWGAYQDYLYGRFDGINHEDEAQTVSDGRKSSHGGDVYYMCPGINYGKFLCVGVQRALDAGAEAIHLEEPEFWVNAGYSEGFKREWQDYYHEAWQAPNSSVTAQWKASKLKYYLYRRALQQVFDHIHAYNERTGRKVRCYVATHSLINYASWDIVSPESSLARLQGCDGYIAQVWTGTARTRNVYQGKLAERTFETAFLEYGAMQNLVRSTGRSVWYLNDPIEDNPNHDWDDYKRNWECTMTASLLQPDVAQYEVAPWPERIFNGRYPKKAPREERKGMPPEYATELQIVCQTLNDMKQPNVKWDCGTTGVGVLVSDSLMFQRGAPIGSDRALSHVYGMALPLLKKGLPVTPVQLENCVLPAYLADYKILLLSYQGQKPLSPDVHTALAAWVKEGGALILCDEETDAFNQIPEWWNQAGKSFPTPLAHLFTELNLTPEKTQTHWTCGKGQVNWLRKNPTALAESAAGATQLTSLVQATAEARKLPWKETNYLILQRGPFTIAAGLDESLAEPAKQLTGPFLNLFDPALRPLEQVSVTPNSRYFLRKLDPKITDATPRILAAACKVLPVPDHALEYHLEGVGETPGIILFQVNTKPTAITIDNEPVTDIEYNDASGLLWVKFPNESKPRTLALKN